MKRKEMVDQFQVTVKQELINWAKDKETIHQRISQLENRLDMIEARHEGRIGQLDSDVKRNELLLQQNVVNLNKLSTRSQSEVRDLSQTVWNAMDKFHAYFRKTDQVEQSLSNINLELSESERRNEAREKHLKAQIYDLGQTERLSKKSIERNLSRKIDELQNRPKDVPDLKNLEHKLNSHKVDVNSVNNAMAKVLSSLFVLEKKIEHIYTLLGRMKGGGK